MRSYLWVATLLVAITLPMLPASSEYTSLLLVYEVSSGGNTFKTWYIVLQGGDTVVVLEPSGRVASIRFDGGTLEVHGVEQLCYGLVGLPAGFDGDTILACLLASPPAPALPSSLVSALPKLGEVRVVVYGMAESVELKAKPSNITVSPAGNTVAVSASLEALGLKATTLWRADGILLESSLATGYTEERQKLVVEQVLGQPTPPTTAQTQSTTATETKPTETAKTGETMAATPSQQGPTTGATVANETRTGAGGEAQASGADAWLLGGLIAFLILLAVAVFYVARRLSSPL